MWYIIGFLNVIVIKPYSISNNRQAIIKEKLKKKLKNGL
jgi:DNA-directed RNA polymerase subunit E'/Rpb7